MERARHVLRIGFLLLLLVSGVTLARAFLLPKSYGEYGPYRFDNVAEQRAKPVIHGGAKSCQGCHEKQWQLREDGEAHLKVSCEVCHGPLGLHATGPDKDKDKKIADMPIDKTARLCALCHRRLESRPAGFPQINFDEKHTKGEKLDQPGVCKKCHDPHTTMFEEEAKPEEKDEKPAEKAEEKKP